jgi:sodium-dependent dicarboxylate transporter 2/3/5
MKDKKTIHFLIAIALDILISLFVPAANGLTEIGVRTIGAAVATVYLWTFVATDWTSILSVLLFAITGVMPFSSLLTTGAVPVMLIIVMSAVTIPLSKTGVIARLINWFVTRKFLRGRPWLFLAFYFAAIYIVGCFMDVAACALIALPVARELCREIGYEDDSKFATTMYLGVIWYSMWGYAATPIGHTVSIIIMGLVESTIGKTMSMFDFMKVGIPSTIVLGIFSFLVFRFIVRPDVSKFINYDPEAHAAKMSSKMSKGEKRTVIVFILIVAGMLFPDLCKGFLPEAASFVSSLTINAPAIVGIAVLFVLKDENNERLLDFSKQINQIPWGAVILVFGMFVVAPCLTAENTGIPVWFANLLSPITSNMTSWVPLVLIVALFSAVLTNFMSCNAIANIAFSLIAPIAVSLSPMVSLTALAVVVAIAANVGIMTPAASAASAIVLGSGASSKAAMKYGAIMIPISVIICLAVVYPLGIMLLPF